jgi:type IV pilus assembly protein PilZ
MKPKSDRRKELMPVVEDRRAGNRRIDARVPVELEVDYRASDTFLFAYITDISAMGIFVRTETPEPRGTRLNLRFRVNGGDLMELEGEVIWINPLRPDDSEGRNPGMGIQFRNLSAAQREEMLRLVRTFAYLNDEEEEDDEPVGPS